MKQFFRKIKLAGVSRIDWKRVLFRKVNQDGSTVTQIKDVIGSHSSEIEQEDQDGDKRTKTKNNLKAKNLKDLVDKKMDEGPD